MGIFDHSNSSGRLPSQGSPHHGDTSSVRVLSIWQSWQRALQALLKTAFLSSAFLRGVLTPAKLQSGRRELCDKKEM